MNPKEAKKLLNLFKRFRKCMKLYSKVSKQLYSKKFKKLTENEKYLIIQEHLILSSLKDNLEHQISIFQTDNN